MRNRDQEIWDELIRALAERDDSVEIQSAAENDSACVNPTYRTRLLSVTDTGAVVVESPRHAGLLNELQPGDVVSILAVRDGVRMTGVCRIESRMHYELNEHTRVIAFQLTPAEEVRSAQRRQFFRVDAAGEDIPPVELRPLFPDADAEDGYREAGLDPVHGTLVNIGGGGLGLIVSASAALVEALPNCRCYECVIDLPRVQERVLARAQLVHIQPKQDKTFYLGMQFVFSTPRERSGVEDQIVKFTTSVERRHLRQKRA